MTIAWVVSHEIGIMYSYDNRTWVVLHKIGIMYSYDNTIVMTIEHG